MVELRPRSRRPLRSSGPNISTLFPASFEPGVGRLKKEGPVKRKKESTLPYHFIAGFLFQLVHMSRLRPVSPPPCPLRLQVSCGNQDEFGGLDCHTVECSLAKMQFPRFVSTVGLRSCFLIDIFIYDVISSLLIQDGNTNRNKSGDKNNGRKPERENGCECVGSRLVVKNTQLYSCRLTAVDTLCFFHFYYLHFSTASDQPAGSR